MKRYFGKTFKNFDFFPKTTEDIKDKSSFGALVTIIAVVIAFILLASEFGAYFYTQKQHVLTVDHSQIGATMPINFKILFMSLPCDSIFIDVGDQLGNQQVGLKKGIEKTPWKGDFSDTEKREKSSPASWIGSKNGMASRMWNRLKQQTTFRRIACESCYEASRDPGQCCNSCVALKKAFVDKGLNPVEAQKYPQCQDNEGCMVSGPILVNKIQGNFHIAVGESHVEGHGHHHHWPESHRQFGFNTSHYISSLSFGETFPGMINPLDGFSFVENGVGKQQYFIQVVPTVYEDDSGRLTETNQYSITYLHTPIDVKEDKTSLPGVYFKYDINPLKIHIKNKNVSLAQLITRVCAVVGGVWVVSGLFYSLTSVAIKTVTKKKD